MTVVLHHSEASGTDKVVLLGIANHDNDHGAWPKVSTLAKYARCSERAVQYAVQRLIASGELRVLQQEGGTKRTRGGYETNVYEILVRCPEECDGTLQHRMRGETGFTPRPVRGETGFTPGVKQASPLQEPNMNPTKELEPNASSRPVSSETRSGPIPLPRGWKASQAMMEFCYREFSRFIDVDVEQAAFAAYYVEHQERRSSDWNAKFGQWCARHAAETREKRVQAEEYDDDMGIPRRQRAPRERTPEELAAEAEAVRRRYET
jgi:hypothetical protein